MHHLEIHSETAPKPVGSYPHAYEAGPFLYLSGIGPRIAGRTGLEAIPGGVTVDENGLAIQYDMKAQCHQVMDNVKQVLSSSGVDLTHLVDITVFLINMQKDFAVFNDIYAQYFKDHRPARTTLGIHSLPTPIAIELKCVALKAK